MALVFCILNKLDTNCEGKVNQKCAFMVKLQYLVGGDIAFLPAFGKQRMPRFKHKVVLKIFVALGLSKVLAIISIHGFFCISHRPPKPFVHICNAARPQSTMVYQHIGDGLLAIRNAVSTIIHNFGPVRVFKITMGDVCRGQVGVHGISVEMSICVVGFLNG